MPVSDLPVCEFVEDNELITATDLDILLTGIVAGSNLIQFENSINPVLRSSVALSILAAQRVASSDGGVADPDQWIEHRNMVPKILTGWWKANSEFDSNEVAVHNAIIPWTTLFERESRRFDVSEF